MSSKLPYECIDTLAANTLAIKIDEAIITNYLWYQVLLYLLATRKIVITEAYEDRPLRGDAFAGKCGFVAMAPPGGIHHQAPEISAQWKRIN